MRRIGVVAVVVASFPLLASAPAQAATTLLDFDSVAAGTTINTESGITFVGGPKTFVPAHVATISPPNALHTNGTCVGGGSVCPSGANKLEITLTNPAGLVGMYVGLDDETAEAEFGDSARLVAYDKNGAVVADTGNSIGLGAGDYTPINHHIFVSSDEVDIKKVLLIVGEGGTPRRVNIDNVEVQDEAVVFYPPSTKIESPATGAQFDRADDLRVSGRVSAPTGVLRFCLTADASPPAGFPADCNQLDQVSAANRFTDLRVAPLVTGTNHITAWVEDRQLHQVHDTIDVVLKENDLSITNMEVTQAVQKALPTPTPDDHDSTHAAAYGGVPLIDDKSTAVRVWTSARLDATGTPVHGAAVYLYGEKADGTPLPGGPIPAKEGTRDIGPALSFGPLIDMPTWSNPATSWTFTLPWAWQQTHGPITLRAVVNPPTAYPRVSECGVCEGNNTLRLTDIRFQRAHTLNVYPFRVFYNREGKFIAPPERPWSVFREVIKISPFDINVHPWVGTLNAQSIADDKSLDGDAQTSAIYDRMMESVDIAGYPGFLTLAVNRGLGPGVTSSHWSWHSFTYRTYAVVEAGRPLTSVGHEIYHTIDYTHAGRSCDEAVQRGGAEFWPPEDRGLLESMGTDLTPLWEPASRQLKLFGFFDSAGNPTENFDLMSYCFSDEAHVWISALNWERAVGRVASATGSTAVQTAGAVRSRIATTSAGPSLGVSAEIGGGGGHILRVEPGKGRVNAPAAGSDVSFRVRDKKGQVVSDTPVAVQPTHIDLVNHGTSLVEVSAAVPAAGAASIELVKGGIVLDTFRRSASPPRITLLAPHGGAGVGSAGSLQVRWRAKDRDRDKLLASLDFSADGGKHWKAVAAGLPGNHYAVPVSFLSHTADARLRVRVNDGWDAASATSARFSVEGPPPQVTIESPPDRTKVRAGDPLNLEGSGFDDSSQGLSGRRLQWFDGRRDSLGHGPHLSVLDLSPGKHTLRLVATDRRGRSGEASVRVTVTPTKPAFIVLEPPAKLSGKARKVTIRAAASLSGTLAAGGKSFPIDRRTRKYRFKVKSGKGSLRLRLSLRGGGKAIGAKLAIPRS